MNDALYIFIFVNFRDFSLTAPYPINLLLHSYYSMIIADADSERGVDDVRDYRRQVLLNHALTLEAVYQQRQDWG